MKTNPYILALDLVQKNEGTGNQLALAKCILSLYNQMHPFSIGDILQPLDQHYTDLVLAMITFYSAHGETDELRDAGIYVCRKFPKLMELSVAMQEARTKVFNKWEKERVEKDCRLFPDEYDD